MLESNRLSDLLQDYLESVLKEYDLDVSMLFSATSDAGSDVKRLCDILLPGLWEWCVCHMLNCTLVEVVFWAAYGETVALPLSSLLQMQCIRFFVVLDLNCLVLCSACTSGRYEIRTNNFLVHSCLWCRCF